MYLVERRGFQFWVPDVDVSPEEIDAFKASWEEAEQKRRARPPSLAPLKKPNWMVLPGRLWTCIFSFLKVSQVAALSAICKLWSRLTADPAAYAAATEDELLKAKLADKRRFRGITSLQLSGSPNSDAQKLQEILGPVTRLTHLNANVKGAETVLPLIKASPNLTSLRAEMSAAVEVLPHCPQLRSLVAVSAFCPPDGQLEALGQALQQLSELQRLRLVFPRLIGIQSLQILPSSTLRCGRNR